MRKKQDTHSKATMPPPFDKRIVLLVTSGPYTGLHQITGTVSQAVAAVGSVPEFVDECHMPPHNHRLAPAGLVKVEHRFLLFKECAGPQTSRFDEMHPQQR